MHHLDVLLDPALGADRRHGAVVPRNATCSKPRRATGSVRFSPRRRPASRSSRSTGESPFADQSPDRFAGLTAERPTRSPTARDNSYPFAFEQVAQLFDHPAAPDVCVVHSAAHNWEDQGGHRRRARLARRRAGPRAVRHRGQGRARRRARRRARAGSSTSRPRLALLGARLRATAVLACQDGAALDRGARSRRGARPSTSSASCFDGTNANVLYAMAARGDAPNVARLIEMGTAYEHGAMSSLPDRHARQPHVDPHRPLPRPPRHPAQRVVRPRAGRAGDHQLAWPRGRGRWSHLRRRRRDAARADPPHVARRVHRVGQRAVRRRRRLLHVRVLPQRRRVARSPTVPRASRTPPSGSCGRRRTTRGRTTVDHLCVDQAVVDLGGRVPRRRRTRTRSSCGATSRSPTPRSTRAAPTPRSPPHRCATPTPASATCSTRSSVPACSTTPRSSSSPTTAWRRPTRRCTGDWDVALRDAGIRFRDEGYGFLYLDEE